MAGLGDTPAVTDYEFVPLSVQIYDRHCRSCVLHVRGNSRPRDALSQRVTGKWSEVYLRKDNQWVMISVSGRPDSPAECSGVIE